MVRLCTALLLICASAGVSARDVSMESPNGETGSCPEIEAAASPKTEALPTTAVRKPVGKAHATTQGGGGEAPVSVRSPGPRWHSFLPGMFR